MPTHTAATDITIGQVKKASLDIREVKLSEFFKHYKCPPINFTLIPTYVSAADKYNLDYRLLPAISRRESTCFEHPMRGTNNGWGYDSKHRKSYKTPEEGIDDILQHLSSGGYYKGLSIPNKLKNYGPHKPNGEPSPTYYKEVMTFMNQIDN